VTLNVRAADNAADRGGDPGKRAGAKSVDDGPRASLGAVVAAGAEPKLQYVYNGRPAERAGLAAGDVLVAIDGLRVGAGALESLLEHRRPGETLAIHAFRRDELMSVNLTLDAVPLDTCWLTQTDDAPAAAQARRVAWLGPD
jgi:predicted metalloprotease with PDZ domain